MILTRGNMEEGYILIMFFSMDGKSYRPCWVDGMNPCLYNSLRNSENKMIQRARKMQV
jgi:hypothetical protein